MSQFPCDLLLLSGFKSVTQPLIVFTFTTDIHDTIISLLTTDGESYTESPSLKMIGLNPVS